MKLGHSSADWLCCLCDRDDDRINSTSTHHLSHSLPSLSSISQLDSDNTEPRHTSSPTKPKPSWTKGKPLRIINVNCQSLSGKKGLWAYLLEGAGLDIIIATETWLDKTITNNELEMPHHWAYCVLKGQIHWPRGPHTDCCSLKHPVITDQNSHHLRNLMGKTKLPRQRDLLNGALYQPRVSDKTSTLELFALMDNLSSCRSYNIFLGGDFNLQDGNGKLCPSNQTAYTPNYIENS